MSSADFTSLTLSFSSRWKHWIFKKFKIRLALDWPETTISLPKPRWWAPLSTSWPRKRQQAIHCRSESRQRQVREVWRLSRGPRKGGNPCEFPSCATCVHAIKTTHAPVKGSTTLPSVISRVTFASVAGPIHHRLFY